MPTVTLYYYVQYVRILYIIILLVYARVCSRKIYVTYVYSRLTFLFFFIFSTILNS